MGKTGMAKRRLVAAAICAVMAVAFMPVLGGGYAWADKEWMAYGWVFDEEARDTEVTVVPRCRVEMHVNVFPDRFKDQVTYYWEMTSGGKWVAAKIPANTQYQPSYAVDGLMSDTQFRCTITEEGKQTEEVNFTIHVSEFGAVKPVTTVTVNVAKVNASAVKKAVRKAGTSPKYVTKFVLGKKVRTIKKGSFTSYKRAKTLELKTKKLKAKCVRNCLKGSKVKTVKVKVGSKKANRTYVKKYKKIFKKKIVGKKVKVK